MTNQNCLISELPFNRDAIEKANHLGHLRRPTISSRIEYLAKLCLNRSVLDVGVVDHAYHQTNTGQWLHRHLAEAADRIIGIDVLKQEIEQLSEDGYNVAVHDLSEAPYLEQLKLPRFRGHPKTGVSDAEETTTAPAVLA